MSNPGPWRVLDARSRDPLACNDGPTNCPWMFEKKSRIRTGGGACPLPPKSGLPEVGISYVESYVEVGYIRLRVGEGLG